MAANPAMLEDDEGEVMELPEESPDVEDTDDGGAIIRMDSETPDPSETIEFYSNLVRTIPAEVLKVIATDLLEKIDDDKRARSQRDKQQEEGIRRTGLGNDAPGGATFEGASRVVHPMLTKATVEFESRAISELMPPGGPVKDFIPGRSTKARVEKARRKTTYMNWQFTVQMPEFRSELEQLLTQLPLGGSQFLRLVYDHKKRRPVPIFVPIDDIYLPYAASNFYTAERMTYVEHITDFEFNNRLRSKQYIEPVGESVRRAPSITPQQTESAQASDKIEGKEDPATNTDGMRDVYEVMTYSDFEDPDGEMKPYLITLCESSQAVISVVRNWEEQDDTFQPMPWIIEFGFVPWRGAYHIGLTHMIGWISAAATGALRALLDSAHINNLPTLLKLKGANFSGQNVSLAATTITEIEGAISTDDIRKLIMAVPFNPPSGVLVELLGLLIKEGNDTVKTALDNLSENAGNEMPVGTTMALIEQGMKVLAAIHQRMHASMDMVIKVLHRINRMYVTSEEIKDDTGETMAYRKDFQAPLDVVPVSDPQIFSDVQRFAQIQMVAARAAGNPLYDARKVEEMILERTKIPNAKDLLIAAPKPQEMNPVNENVAASLGRPIAAFPEQDHLAHLQVHLDFLQSPFFGALAVIAPNFIPAMLSHLREHIVLWYVNETFEAVEPELTADGMSLEEILDEKDPEVKKEFERLLAEVSPDIVESAEQYFADYPNIIAQAMKIAQQYAQPPVDPKIAAAQIAAQSIQARITGEQQRTQAQEQGATQRQVIKDKSKMTEEQFRAAQEEERLRFKETQQNRRNAEDNRVKERTNVQDNLTAMTIAAAQVEQDGETSLQTGSGIDPGSGQPGD